MISFSEYIITISYAPFIGIAFMMIYLVTNSTTDSEVKRTFWRLLILELLEMIAYDWELVTAQWEHPTILRITLSVIGYSIRPAMVYLLLLLVMRIPYRSKKALLCSIPVAINAIIHFTAYFCGIAFSYDENNIFVRGPLGYLSQVTVLLYLLGVVVLTCFYASNRAKLENVIVCASGILCTGAMVVEAIYSIRSFGRTSVVMAVIFYFMYFQSTEYTHKMEESKTINSELKKISSLDALTGLLNKRAFLEQMDQMIASAPDTSCVIFFFDLDNFKKYNDTLGHLAGDELLKKIADKMRTVFRDEDLIGRFGGDEFYIYMDEIPYETVVLRAEQLLEHLCIKSEKGETDVTASIGIIYLKQKAGITSGDLVRRADSALYDAKRQGKNRYVIRTTE